jgi:hypothetical protein
MTAARRPAQIQVVVTNRPEYHDIEVLFLALHLANSKGRGACLSSYESRPHEDDRTKHLVMRKRNEK